MNKLKKYGLALVACFAMAVPVMAQNHASETLLAPFIYSLAITNGASLGAAAGVTNQIWNPISGNGAGSFGPTNGWNTGIYYTNGNTLVGVPGGFQYGNQTAPNNVGTFLLTTNAPNLQAGINVTAYGTNTLGGAYGLSTNDTTSFFQDVAVVPDKNGNFNTNQAVIIDYIPNASGNASNLWITLAPILSGDLNSKSAIVDLGNQVQVYTGTTGLNSANGHVTIAKTFVPYVGGYVQYKGIRIVNVVSTNINWGATITAIRLNQWVP